MNNKLTILAVVVLIAALIALSNGLVQAGHVSCGDTLIINTTLDENLTCTDTPGLIIGASNITVDLNGFTLTGDPCAKCHGIRNGDIGTSPSFNKVTVRNGIIDGFEQGIRAQGSPGGTELKQFTITNVVVRGQTSSSAIDIIDSKDVKIEHSIINIPSGAPDTVEAIRLESVNGVKVYKVHVVGGAVGVNFGCDPCPDPNGPTNGEIKNSTFVNNGNGIFLAHTTKAKVENNVVTGSGATAVLVGLKCFVGTFPAITNVEILKNVVSNNEAAGITLCTADNSKVIENIVTGNGGRGIRLLGDSPGDKSINNIIEKNIAFGNTAEDMFHAFASTPNTWVNNTCGTKSGADIDC